MACIAKVSLMMVMKQRDEQRLDEQVLDEQVLKKLLAGGCILGGGGGESMDMGWQAGCFALSQGPLKLLPLNALDPQTLLATASLVGAPASGDKQVLPENHVRAARVFEDSFTEPVGGFISNENGGMASINGWIAAATLGLPLIDAPCNGRAHPTGKMGGMGLHHVDDYLSCQAFAGGNRQKGLYLEGYIQGRLGPASRLVRQAAIQAGGLVTVIRNPVRVEYVKNFGAPGAITHAIETGDAFYQGYESGPGEAAVQVAHFLKGEIVCCGTITRLCRKTRHGFDVGHLEAGDAELTFWNEYMTLEIRGERRYTFPDLIMTLDADSGIPLTSAEIQTGKKIRILATRKKNLVLSVTMNDLSLLEEIEPVVKKPIVPYNQSDAPASKPTKERPHE